MSARTRRDPSVAAWLFACAFFVAAMVGLGGVTRLTHSGLSIVDWRPILGALPPLGDAAWRAEFAKYQASPEFRLVNSQFGLDGFRAIYWVEWAHRLLGRLTGLVVLAPLLYFVARRRIDGPLMRRLLGLFTLGAAQGVLGWCMVKSGLVDEPHVSPYRLTAHLLFALVLFVALLWVALDEAMARPAPAAAAPLAGVRRATGALLALLGVTITWGGLMAGFRAGLIAPTFPTMNGAWFPPGLWSFSPLVANPVANAVAIHFLHRLLAYAVALGALVLAFALRRRVPAPRVVRRLAVAMVAAVAVQITLGALVVLFYVPVVWASLHQVNAVVLLGALVALLHQLTPPATRTAADAVPVAPTA